ncbi:MAG: TonB-dependent receptor [Betaproteobacteria bacterium]
MFTLRNAKKIQTRPGASVKLRPLPLLAAMAAIPAWSQTAPPPAAAASAPEATEKKSRDEAQQAQTITITANRRKELAKDVAGAVSVLGGSRLDELGVTGVADMAAYVPGLVVSGTRSGSQQLAIRGITTGIDQTSATVGVYIDESPVSFNSGYSGGSTLTVDPDPLDIERVEVLKGPQGSLYGASALGGLIKYVMVSPDLKSFNGRAELGINKVSGGGTGNAVRAAINVPLATNLLAVRASAYRREEAGYLDNVASGKTDINKLTVSGGTISALLKPGAAFNARLTADTQTISGQDNSTPQADLLTLKPAYGSLLNVGWQLPVSPSKSEQNRANLALNYDAGFATVLSSTSYFRGKNETAVDLTPTTGGLAALFGANTVNFPISVDNRKATQELRLTSPGGQSLDWLTGAFFTDEKVIGTQTMDFLVGPAGGPFTPVVPGALTFKYGARLKESSVYANATYKLSDPFDIQFGLRQTSIRQVYSQNELAILGAPPSPTGDVHANETHTTGMISPRWRLDAQTMVYARAATGYRPGGPNFDVAGAVSPRTFDTDKLLNLEVGIKGAVPAAQFDYAVALFNTDWKNIQARGVDPVTGTSFQGNGGRAHTRGLEVEGRWRVNSALAVGGNAAFTDAKLDEDINITGINAKKGNTIPFVPKLAFGLTADYSAEVMPGVMGVFGTTVRHVGQRNAYFDDTQVGTGVQSFVGKMPAYDLVDLRAAFTKDIWTLSLMVKNVFDKRGITTVSGNYIGPGTAPGTLTPAGVTITQPRTIGVTLRAEF